MSNLAAVQDSFEEGDSLKENAVNSTVINDSSSDEFMRIQFTANAVNKVKELIEEEGNPELCLRVFITGGGCSGFQYGFTFDEIINDDDFVIEKDGVKFLVDAMSSQYLVGAEIDYVDSFEGSQFTIKNPNATTTCGCGSSFSV